MSCSCSSETTQSASVRYGSEKISSHLGLLSSGSTLSSSRFGSLGLLCLCRTTQRHFPRPMDLEMQGPEISICTYEVSEVLGSADSGDTIKPV